MVEEVAGAAVNLTVTPDTDGSLRRLWLSCNTNTSSAEENYLCCTVCVFVFCILLVFGIRSLELSGGREVSWWGASCQLI